MEKWLLGSDIHFPKQDDKMVSIFLDVVRKWKPHAIDLVGDIDDACGTSRWSAGSVEEVTSSVVSEVKLVNEFLDQLREAAPKADIHFHDGNHGWTRHNDYIKKNAKALDGLITPWTLYNLDQNGIEWHSYQEPPVKRLGEYYVHHGVAISKNAGESVRKDMEDWDVSLIRGHSHRMGFFPKNGLVRSLRGWEIGHMCDPDQMDYGQVFNWQPGFAYGHVDGTDVHLSLAEIKNYSAVVDGKKFSA